MRSGACLSSGLGSRSGSAFSTMPKTMSSFRNFKNRVHTLKWYLFSGNRYTCGMPFSNKWIASYVRKKAFSFKRKRRRQLSAESNAGKRNWHMMKGCTWILADKIWRDLIFIILMLYLIFRSSLSSSNLGDSSLRFVSVFLLSTPTCWNFKISMTSLYPNTSSIQSQIQVSLLSLFSLGFF